MKITIDMTTAEARELINPESSMTVNEAILAAIDENVNVSRSLLREQRRTIRALNRGQRNFTFNVEDTEIDLDEAELAREDAYQ